MNNYQIRGVCNFCMWVKYMNRHFLNLLCIVPFFILMFIHNNNSLADGKGTVHFSHASGFYNESFWLKLWSDDGQIYYTLDGSEPDCNSILYNGRILIEDASNNPNQYCLIRDVCLELMEAYRPLLTVFYGYKVPDKVIDKATIIRAVSIDSHGNMSEIANGIYYIGYQHKDSYDGISILSIVTSPKNLFDQDTGIYITGQKLAQTMEKGIPQNPNWGWWPANYTQRGQDWERKAWICLFDENKEMIFSGNFGIRLQGGSSRGMLPKSLNLFARKIYGKESNFSSLCEKYGAEMGSMNLYAGAHSMATKLNDYLVNTVGGEFKYFS